MLVLSFHSSLSHNAQAAVFTSSDRRKCIFATNVAETSIAIDEVEFLVDPGRVKVMKYNARANADSLEITNISKPSAHQRAGRSGRTRPGVCYTLYTEQYFNEDFVIFDPPEIMHSNLESTLLRIKTFDKGNIFEFPFLDSPPPEALLRADQNLTAM